jgi:hypothetical protein
MNSPAQRLIPIEVADGKLNDNRMAEAIAVTDPITVTKAYLLSILSRRAEVVILRKRE